MPQPSDRPRATICVVLNLLVLPGFGTIMARRRSGWGQAILAVIGFGLNVAWAMWFFSVLFHSGQLPEDLTAHLGLALSGLALFLIAWLWTLVSSLQILRAARPQPQGNRVEHSDQ